MADSLWIQNGVIAKFTASIILIMSCVMLGISLITKEVNQAVLTALVGIASSAGTFLFVKRDKKE